MSKTFSMSMFANETDLYKAKAEHFEAKYRAAKLLVIDLQATLRAIQSSSNAMMEQCEKEREFID